MVHPAKTYKLLLPGKEKCYWLLFIMEAVVSCRLGVLPPGLLIFAVPLSLLEAFVASLIVLKLGKGREQ
jgi:hypothetical protein